MLNFVKRHCPFVIVACIFAGVLVLMSLDGRSVPTATNRPHQPSDPAVVTEVMDPSLEVFAPYWQREVARRFDNAVVVICHGGDFVSQHWILGASIVPGHVTPVEDVLRMERAKYPTRTIVLTACNTGHVVLHGFPGVWYFKNEVWCLPDRAVGDSSISADMLLAKMDDLSFQDACSGIFPSRPTLASRWEQFPDVNGNIFEAVEAQ